MVEALLFSTPHQSGSFMDIDPDPTRVNDLRVVGAGVDVEAPLRQRIRFPFEVMD